MAVASALLLASLWGFIAVDLRHEREIHVAQAQRDNENLGIAFQHHVESTVVSVDALLLSLRHELLENVKPGKSTDLLEWAHRGPLKDSIVQIGFIDPKGYLVFTSADRPEKPIYVGDRDHFRAHADSPEDKLYISTAIRVRTSNLDLIPFSRRVASADGRFLGVVSVLLRTEHFSSFYRSIQLGSQGAVTLVRNGQVLARASGEAPATNPIGLDVRSVLPGPDATTDSRLIVSPVDGLTRLVHFRRVRDQPLAVIVSQTEKDYLAEYRDTIIVQLVIGLTTSLGIVALALLLARQARLLESARQNATRSEIRLRSIVESINVATWEFAIALANQQALLRGLIDSVPDLIFFKDVNSVYLGCNKAFTEFAGRPEGEQIGKTDFDFFDRDTAEFFRMKDREMLASGESRRSDHGDRHGVEDFAG